MSHLGERVADLVDGQLSADAAEKATMHLAGCRACRDAVELERLTKQRLASLGSPEPDTTFLAQLVAMSGPTGPLPPREERLEVVRTANAVDTAGRVPVRAAATRPAGRSATFGRRPGDTRPSGAPARRLAVPRQRLAVAVAAAVLVGTGVTVSGVAAAGAAATGQKVVPAVDTFVVEHGATAAVLPFTDQSIGLGAGAGR